MDFTATSTHLHVGLSLLYGGWCVYEEDIPTDTLHPTSSQRRSHPFTDKGAAMMKMDEYNYDRARQLIPKYDLP